MRIYQPMMFVGLGGTGCRIGAELERRLREELCGPDGTALQDLMQGQGFLPYQLPGCLQFVYADLAEDEFDYVESRVVPDPIHLPAAERTMRMVRELVPPYDSYPEVARSLWLSAAEAVEGWLPPSHGEPQVNPLTRGAAQLPTVARAALFETLRNGLAPAQNSLVQAIGQISNSGGQLSLLGGKLRDSVDVFVAFSVAGGTGAGLFYDYLHLIGDALASEQYKARIFPLVLMPSAFDEGLGGGRPAELNAGRALLDLFQLVDDQNSQRAGSELSSTGISGTLGVRYPNNADEIRLEASTVQTAFLFSRTSGMLREDLHRSVVSLLLSLIGTDLPKGQDGAQLVDRKFQSFADSFINGEVERSTPAATAIGKRGVSTSSVASMTVPVDDLADIISSRLLSDAVLEMAHPGTGTSENNRDLIARFFQDSNVDPLRLRQPLPITEPVAVDGADAVLAALQARKRTMEASIYTLEQQLARQVPELAARFDLRRATGLMLADFDLFRLHRGVLGENSLADEVSRQGFVKLVESRRAEPTPPQGVKMSGPAPDAHKTKWWRNVRWSDPPVRESLRRQDEWFQWRARRAWHAAWNDQTGRWDRKLRAAEREFRVLADAFLDHANGEDARFARRSKALFEPRVGVSYLLPRQGELGPFYQAVLRRLVAVSVEQGKLRANATAAEVVTEIVGAGGWAAAYAELAEHGLGQGPTRAVAGVRALIKAQVLLLFRYRDDVLHPLLASLHDLLLAAAGGSTGKVNDEDLLQFREKLAGLVPGGFAPSGSGRLKILFSYPSPGGTKDLGLEKFLLQEVNLPRESGMIVDFRPIDAESVVVVLFRSSMGLTEVPEVRKVLLNWSTALGGHQPADFLQWRQRTGYRFGHLATTAEDRARILHRVLCAAWNGYLSPTGDPASPSVLNVHLGDSPVNMKLELDPYGKLSSWSSLLGAYERWVLADSKQIRRDFCEKLMTTLPLGLTRELRKPSELFGTLFDLADSEAAQAKQLLASGGSAGRRRLEAVQEFWAVTFREAITMSFRGVEDAQQDNLLDLYKWATK